MKDFKKYFIPGSLGGLLGILAGFLIYHFTGRHHPSFVILGFLAGAFIGSLLVKTIVIKIKVRERVKSYFVARKALTPEQILSRKLKFYERCFKLFLAILCICALYFFGKYISTAKVVSTFEALILIYPFFILPAYTYIFFLDWSSEPNDSSSKAKIESEELKKRRLEYFQKVGPAKYLLRLFLGYFQNLFVGAVWAIIGFIFYIVLIAPLAIVLFAIFVGIWIMFGIFRFYIYLVDKHSLLSTILVSLSITLALYFRYRGLFDDVGIALAVAGLAFIIAGSANYIVGYGLLHVFNYAKLWWEKDFKKTKVFAFLNGDDDTFLWGLVGNPVSSYTKRINPIMDKVIGFRYH